MESRRTTRFLCTSLGSQNTKRLFNTMPRLSDIYTARASNSLVAKAESDAKFPFASVCSFSNPCSWPSFHYQAEHASFSFKIEQTNQARCRSLLGLLISKSDPSFGLLRLAAMLCFTCPDLPGVSHYSCYLEWPSRPDVACIPGLPLIGVDSRLSRL